MSTVTELIAQLGALVATADDLDAVRSVSMMFSAASSALRFEVEAGHV
jgi:hypothetical protein